MKKRILILCLAALLLAGCGSKKSSAAPTADDTMPAQTRTPDFTAFNSNSEPVKLSDYFDKPIVLNFWASWCGPCTGEMPTFQAVYEELGDEVQFLMVNVGETVDNAEAFLTSAGYTFPVLFDVNGEAAYAYQISAIPMTYFINSDGEIVDSHVGSMNESTLRSGISAIQP